MTNTFYRLLYHVGFYRCSMPGWEHLDIFHVVKAGECVLDDNTGYHVNDISAIITMKRPTELGEKEIEIFFMDTKDYQKFKKRINDLSPTLKLIGFSDKQSLVNLRTNFLYHLHRG